MLLLKWRSELFFFPRSKYLHHFETSWGVGGGGRLASLPELERIVHHKLAAPYVAPNTRPYAIHMLAAAVVVELFIGTQTPQLMNWTSFLFPLRLKLPLLSHICDLLHFFFASSIRHSAILAIEKFWVNARKFGMWIWIQCYMGDILVTILNSCVIEKFEFYLIKFTK